MIAGTAQITIRATPDKVFAVLTDPSRFEEWLPGHGGWPDGPPGTLTHGATYRHRLGQLGIHDTVTITVEECDPGSTLALYGKGSYGADLRQSFGLFPAPDSSVLLQLDSEVIGTPARIIAGPAKRLFIKRQQQALERIKKYVEENHDVH